MVWHLKQSVLFSVVGGMLPVKLASPINRTGTESLLDRSLSTSYANVLDLGVNLG